jgi:arylsulfatase A-like enzyme
MPLIKPNIVFIVLDTHRADRLGCYGYTRNTSPNIDAFAETATLFENAITPAQWTIPAHASMFSGEYPSTHNTIQASDALSPNFKTLAENLKTSGYQTTGFCNNPLVGVLDNGFRRGFDEFYNYGGTIPITPATNGHNPRNLFSKIRRQYYKIIDRIATPIQQAVAASPDVFQIILSPWLVPLWTHFANFKGDTAASIRDTTQFFESATQTGDAPQFVFLNLMGTHLPYAPPKRFIDKFAPIVLENPRAKEFINVYNTRALDWLLPLEKPYPALESQTLNNMYDAEVAYQDFLLCQLLATLDHPKHHANTMVVIVSDHGEMLGEHQIMGHGLGVHQELVHVPLMIRMPGQDRGQRVQPAVSTTRVFHSILAAAGIESVTAADGEMVDLANQSLIEAESLPKYVFSEAYPPVTLIKTIEKYAPNLMDQFQCKAPRWAVFNQPYKLIRTQNWQDDIYNYVQDPCETENLPPQTDHSQELRQELENFLEIAISKGQKNPHSSATNLEDAQVIDRLRSLGYIE